MKEYCKKVLVRIPFIKDYIRFVLSKNLPNGFWGWLKFRLGLSKTYWPKEKSCLVTHPRKIYVGKNSKVGRPGTYFGGLGTIRIGDYVRMGPNCGILSSNHDLYNRDINVPEPVVIGDYCWIGMNSIIMPGVSLGPSVIVGGGSVVTHSFPDGYVVIAGNPAKIIKNLDKERVDKERPRHEYEYYGYLSEKEFLKKKSKYIDV